MEEFLIPGVDEAKEILEELEKFRKTKLFDYIARKRRYRYEQNVDLILEGDITTAGLRAEREALIGETRLWRDLVKEISGNVEEEMKLIIAPEDDTNE